MNENDFWDLSPRGFDPAQLVARGFTLGGGDLVQGGSLREVVARATIFFLCCRKTEGGAELFRDAVIILPPAGATTVTEEFVYSALQEAVLHLRGIPLTKEEEPDLRRRIGVRHAPTMAVADLLQVVLEQAPTRLVVIAEANRFRDPAIKLPLSFGATATRLPEDRWAPHVASLCKLVGQAIFKTPRYVLVHAAELPATRAENARQLQSVENFSVLALSYGPGDFSEVVAKRHAVWISMALQGRVAEVEVELDSLELAESERLHTLVQIMSRTGRDAETLELLRMLQPHLQGLSGDISIQAAMYAAKAGDADLADEMLPRVADDLIDPVWLEEGLEVATELEDNERIAVFDARLSALAPESERLEENRDRRLLMNCQREQTNGDHNFTTAGFTGQHLGRLCKTPSIDLA
ncbi:hypothetical protein [Roseateles sp. MS654]|uniref:hypothetical protein n=1 Tax=Roseateles sp. MS654 TaxID=3412685 RepID=UPI003C2E2D6D